MPEGTDPGEEPEINAVSVRLEDIVDNDGAEEAVLDEEPEEEKDGGGLDSLMDDIFAEEQDENELLKAFGDLEHLTMTEVSSEVEAVLEELRIRQGGYE